MLRWRSALLQRPANIRTLSLSLPEVACSVLRDRRLCTQCLCYPCLVPWLIAYAARHLHIPRGRESSGRERILVGRREPGRLIVGGRTVPNVPYVPVQSPAKIRFQECDPTRLMHNHGTLTVNVRQCAPKEVDMRGPCAPETAAPSPLYCSEIPEHREHPR